MFGKRSPEEKAYRRKVKDYGSCPPCDDCGGAGEVQRGSTYEACDPCWSTGIDPGPRVPPRNTFKRGR